MKNNRDLKNKKSKVRKIRLMMSNCHQEMKNRMRIKTKMKIKAKMKMKMMIQMKMMIKKISKITMKLIKVKK